MGHIVTKREMLEVKKAAQRRQRPAAIFDVALRDPWAALFQEQLPCSPADPSISRDKWHSEARGTCPEKKEHQIVINCSTALQDREPRQHLGKGQRAFQRFGNKVDRASFPTDALWGSCVG